MTEENWFEEFMMGLTDEDGMKKDTVVHIDDSGIRRDGTGMIKKRSGVIIIYHLELVNGKIAMVERARFENGTVTGKINREGITREEVLDEYNRGYYRTGEI